MVWSKKKSTPQGSILRPLHVPFNIFLNDMFKFVGKYSLYNYADDSSISTASPCVHDVAANLETDCNNIMEWFSVNGLKANPSKFQFILLSSSNIDKCHISLCIDNIILKLEPHVKILGVFLDDKLSFSQHVSAVKLVYNDHPGGQVNMVTQDRWSQTAGRCNMVDSNCDDFHVCQFPLINLPLSVYWKALASTNNFMRSYNCQNHLFFLHIDDFMISGWFRKKIWM